MPYYTGDYYHGAMRRGDPGFLSFLGGLARTAVGFIPGVGPALSSGLGAIMDKSAAPAAAGIAAHVVRAQPVAGTSALVAKLKAGALKHPVLTGAGAAGLAAGAGALAGGMLEKHHLMGGKRRRRMRVTNPKALRRAIRRTTGFAKLAMRTIHIVHPRKKGRFGGFKRKRRS